MSSNSPKTEVDKQATEGVKSLKVGANPFAAAANPFAAAANPFAAAAASNPFAPSGSNPFAAPAAQTGNAGDGEEEDDEEEQDYLHQWMEDKPEDVKRRVIALEVLHQARNTLHAAFSKEVYELEKKYQAMYAPLYDNRSKVVNASTPDDLAKDDGARTHLGLPDFWLVALKNSSLSEEIFEQDEPALKALTDIRTSFIPDEQGVGFTVDFHFKENEFFSNAVLSKTFVMQLPAAEGEEQDFDDEELQKLISTPVQWKAGKNLTVKVVTKKQKKGKQTRTVTKNEPCPSFFSLFEAIEVPNEEQMESMEEEELDAINDKMQMHYDLGCFIKDELVPNAVKFYTGEAIEDEEDDYDDEDEEDEDGEFDDDEDEDEEEEAPPPKGGNKKQGGGNRGPKGPAGQPECKQQ